MQWHTDGQGYGVRFSNDNWQRYNMSGLSQGSAIEGVSSVEWQPDGHSYGVRFTDGRWLFYNMAGEVQGPLLENVNQVQWQPNGPGFSVLFEDRGLVIYQPSTQIENAIFGTQLLIQAVLNKFGKTKEPVKLPLELQILLGGELVSILERNGYIERVRIPNYFRALAIDTASMLSALRQNGAGAGVGPA